jgi:hypothetical protein
LLLLKKEERPVKEGKWRERIKSQEKIAGRSEIWQKSIERWVIEKSEGKLG